jgi:hypothetical protein
VFAAVVALGTGLPALIGTTELQLPTVWPADLGIEWTTLAVEPPALQRAALVRLGGLLVDLGALVLVVAALAIAGVSFLRSAARRTELMVRRAVGASRADLRAAALLEGVALVALALGLGVPVGVRGARLALASWPGAATIGGIGPVVAAATGVAAVIVGGALVAGSAPGRRRGAGRRSAATRGFVVPTVQLGVSLAILVAATQLGRAADATSRPIPQGGGQVIEIRGVGPDAADRARAYTALLDRLGGRGLDVISLASPGTLVGLGTEDLVLTDCGHCVQGGLPIPIRPVFATLHAASPDTFRALHVSVLAGRGLGRGDSWLAPRVAVVNAALARAHFERGQAVGRKIYVGRNGWYAVVGVVQDADRLWLGASLLPPYQVYLSALQQPPDVAELLVRTTRNTRADVRLLSRAALGPGASVEALGTEQGRVAAETAPLRWFARFLKVEGIGVLLIAVLGTFVVTRLWVEAAVPEIVTRRAVGATRQGMLGFVLARTLGVGISGGLFGLWLGIIVSGLLSEVIPGLPPRRLDVLAAPALALLVAAIAGALLPASAAARAAPATLLASHDR